MGISAMSSGDGRELTITVKGRFDFSSLQLFRGAYENAQVKPRNYIINLQESDYLDSSALGMLLALRDHANASGANIRITNCSPDVKKILMITKLDELFSID